MTTDASAAPIDAAASNARRAAFSPALWALLPLGYFAAFGTWAGFERLVARLINDDAAYYVLVARHLFVQGPTYDGLHLTNGVHPLFAILLGALYRLLPLGFEQLAAASVVTCVLLGCGVAYVLLGARASHAATRVAVVSLLSSIAVYPILYRGMEGALALFVAALYLAGIGQGRRTLLGYAVLSLALWAARLELLALPPIVAACAGRARVASAGEARRLLLGWAIALGGFGAYAAASHAWVGLALPVSGLIKQRDGTLLETFVALGVACALTSVALETWPALAARTRDAWMTRALTAFAAVFYLAHAWGQEDVQRQTWYYFPLPGLLAVALLELGPALGARLRRAAAGVIAAVALGASLWEGAFVIPLRGEAWAAMREVAERAKKVASPGDRFMGPGWSALLAGPEFESFSQDGLVGGVAQYRALREGRLLELAYASGVRFLFVSSPSAASPAPRLPGAFRLSLVSEGAVPNGGSLWAALAGQECGLARCGTRLAVYRLERGAPTGAALP